MMKHDMPRGVPRTVDYVELKMADGDRIAIDQPAVGFEGFADHAESRAILGKGLDPEAVVLVRPLDRHAQLLREHPRLPAMVHMAMGDEDLLDLYPGLLHRFFQLGQVAAGIDEGRLVRRGAPQQGAILLKSGKRNDRDRKNTRMNSSH